VSNQADCIKVACDVVLPWNLHECLKLAGEFRAENLIDDPWMTDVVQTKLTALHAYINIRSQLMGVNAAEIAQFSGKEGCVGSASSTPPSFSFELDPPSAEPAPPDDIDMDHGQQKEIGLLDKKQKNRINRELKKASRRAKQSQRTGEPFGCPWCSVRGSCSVSILKHVCVS
jgi:hypothetical protein